MSDEALTKRIEDLERRIANLESSGSYSIIAKSWPDNELYFKKNLSLDECRFFFRDLMKETGKCEDPERSGGTLWGIEAVYGPSGDCLDDFCRWHVQTAGVGDYVSSYMREKYGQ